MKHTTITALFAVVAVLLGLNLIVGGSPSAVAQEPEIRLFPEPPLRIIMIAGTTEDSQNTRYLWRLWSDGTIEENRRRSVGDPVWRGWEVVPEDVFPP